ncbi:hypothetical protein TNCV_4853691 [Trichonephila clavipes]|nr:hypothetical protein TNCV_4853691 [Trichonephila clavipes]
MDKFLSRKRTFDDNKASTSAQTSIVPKIKSRKYSQEYLNFGFTITEVNGEEKPLCVICSKILAADSMKPNKLKKTFRNASWAFYLFSTNTVGQPTRMFAECGVRKEENGVLGSFPFPLVHASPVCRRLVAWGHLCVLFGPRFTVYGWQGELLSIGWWYLYSVSPKRHCCRVSAADKGWWVYPLDPRPDASSIIFWVNSR